MTTEYITYSIKDVTDFYKQLDDNSLDGIEDDTNLCLISQQPLEEQHVTLVCGHKFNYDPFFKDVYNHKKNIIHLIQYVFAIIKYDVLIVEIFKINSFHIVLKR